MRRFTRRRVITSAAGVAAAGLLSGAASRIQKVLVVFKCHFDLGFIDTQAAVMRLYFQKHFPQAIQIAASLRERGATPYVWTTGSWLLYEYLEQAGAAERKRMERAILAGDIAWHAIPFSWQTELLDRSTISGLLGLSKSLDSRFGRSTTGAKMTDVPGHSRGLIGPLSEGGVRFLDIGVNSASTAPQVPDLFLWKEPSGASLLTMYHRSDYGGVVEVPESDLAVAVEVKDDNAGPHTPAEIRKIYARLQKAYPAAAIKPATLSQVAEAVDPYRSSLPIVTQEIGDTWIYGIASDPVKVARYRELQRLRRDWIAQGRWQVESPGDVAFLRRFALATEHTWGTDTKTWLDFDTYTPQALSAQLENPRYKTVENSWVEKRQNLSAAMDALPVNLRKEAEESLRSLQPDLPPWPPQVETRRPERWHSKHFSFQISEHTGALTRLISKASGQAWATSDKPLALCSYQSLSKADYDRFLAAYITVQTDWAPKDFGKPNLEKFGAISQTIHPRLLSFDLQQKSDRCILEAALTFAPNQNVNHTALGAPEKLWLRYTLPDSEPIVEIELLWSNKRSTRMPEALWLTFQPRLPESGQWMLDKVERPVSPFDVVINGNRHMHAVTKGVSYSSPQGGLGIETLDAPLVSLGERSPLAFSKQQPDLQRGIHFCLFNNAWGTNYVQWFGEDMRFRFRLRGL